VLYGLAGFFGLPILFVAVMFAIVYTVGDQVDVDAGAAIASTVAFILVGIYLALAATHIIHRWWRIRRDAEEARRANLDQTNLGPTAADEPV
jgi:ABC-type uncharacterized transport system permease subunit